MVKVTDLLFLEGKGEIDFECWLKTVAEGRPEQQLGFLREAYALARISGEAVKTLTGDSCLLCGLNMGDILKEFDYETIAAALIYESVRYADLREEDIREQLGHSIANLIVGVLQTDAISNLHAGNHSHDQLENLRKMLLAMVADMRVVLIKLAERTFFLRRITDLPKDRRSAFAAETLNIYAPLANRLGIATIKWELEDLSFRYLEPEMYQHIAKSLNRKRSERQTYVEGIVDFLHQELSARGLNDFSIAGRAKHIYSIYKKMKRKSVPFTEIYDVSAVRVLVHSLSECYETLSLVHTLWEQIPEEFDDYIATPKPNGYRSIHTAVIGPDGNSLEIQIRTHDMHHESELGVAAHWQYKEGGKAKSNYESKIAWLRQLLAWQKELAFQEGKIPEAQQVLDDRVYIFTPKGEVIDMPAEATPLDFAYYIHSEVGHRCRGAKVNGTMVPLNHTLKTGDRVDILTAKIPQPSRDWLNPELGYLRTPRAKAKILHWFKQQAYDKNLTTGKSFLDQECKRLHLKGFDLAPIATALNYKAVDDMLASLGAGDLKLIQIINPIRAQLPAPEKETEKTEPPAPLMVKASPRHKNDIQIAGLEDILTHIANCCCPLPGDPIVGYMSKTRGIMIHRQDCPNILAKKSDPRLMLAAWNAEKPLKQYATNLHIEAHDRTGLLRDLTLLLSNEKINVLAIKTHLSRKTQVSTIALTVEVPDVDRLEFLTDSIRQLTGVFNVTRLT